MKLFYLLSLLSLSAAFFLAAQKSTDPAPVPVEQEPHHHTLLKNDYVVVLHVTIPEGERTLYHIHSHDRFSVDLTSTNISLQDWNEAEGPSIAANPGRITNATEGASPVIHRVHDLGPGTYEVLDIELLQRPAQPSTAIAAPVVAENPSARVYSWNLAPGAVSTMHTHTRPYLIIAVTGMPLKMTAPDGQSFAHEVHPGGFHWVDSQVTHSLANEGALPGQIIEVELK